MDNIFLILSGGGFVFAVVVGLLLHVKFKNSQLKYSAEIAEKKSGYNELQQKYDLLQQQLRDAQMTEGQLQTRLEMLQKQIELHHDEKEKLEYKLEDFLRDRELLGQKVIRLESALSEERNIAEAQINTFRDRLQHQQQVQAEHQERLTVEFQNLAQNILSKNTKELQEKSVQNLDLVLAPLKDQLGDFARIVHETNEKSVIRNQDLKNELQNINKTALQMSSEAQALTRSLKSQSQVRGAWGEMILERSLESAGLQKGREYETQDSFISDEGNRVRPDAIVKLPGERVVIIDSKLSLIDYNNYINATEDAARETALKAHCNAVKTHIKQLSNKAYHDISDLKSPDFVIMFVPLESALMAALEQDPLLAEEALQNNIGIASPSTIMMILRTIENLWRTERQIENAEEIAKRGAVLYDKFRGFTEDLMDARKYFDQSQRALDDSFNKLSEGRGNLISQAEKLRDLGVKPKKRLAIQSNAEEF